MRADDPGRFQTMTIATINFRVVRRCRHHNIIAISALIISSFVLSFSFFFLVKNLSHFPSLYCLKLFRISKDLSAVKFYINFYYLVRQTYL